MRSAWFVGISPGNKFFYDYRNILLLLRNAPKNNRVIITSPLELHKVNIKCRRISEFKERKQFRYCCNRIDESITNIKKLNLGYEFIDWKTLENFNDYERNVKTIMEDKDLFPFIYSNTNNIIQKISKLHNKEPPSNELIMYGTSYLVKEFAVLMNLRKSLDIDKCTISYPNKIDVLDYFIEKYGDNWLKIEYLDKT